MISTLYSRAGSFSYFIAIHWKIFLLLHENVYCGHSLEALCQVQLTLVISNSKGLTETLWDIRTSTYQSSESEENNKLNYHI